MATKKANKRPTREKIREQQAYASMEIAVWEHQEAQHSKIIQSSRSVVVVQESVGFHTPMASALQPLANPSAVELQPASLPRSESETPLSATPKDIAEPATPAVVLSSDGKLTAAEYPHEWMKRAATQSAQDLSIFLLFVLLLFTLIGVLGR